jgi:trk system potassium uptake protein TrkH
MTDSEKNGITDYCLLFAFVLFGSVILLCLLGNNFSVSFYTALSMFNNMGPCLASEIGATASYASFNWGSKLVMILDMIIGRLEIIPVLMLFSPKAWSKKY